VLRLFTQFLDSCLSGRTCRQKALHRERVTAVHCCDICRTGTRLFSVKALGRQVRPLRRVSATAVFGLWLKLSVPSGVQLPQHVLQHTAASDHHCLAGALGGHRKVPSRRIEARITSIADDQA
jgi:hypothetical protein